MVIRSVNQSNVSLSPTCWLGFSRGGNSICDNTWRAEGRWQCYEPCYLPYYRVHQDFVSRFEIWLWYPKYSSCLDSSKGSVDRTLSSYTILTNRAKRLINASEGGKDNASHGYGPGADWRKVFTMRFQKDWKKCLLPIRTRDSNESAQRSLGSAHSTW